MAGNFWQSSHCQQWILDRQVLDRQIDALKDLQSFSEEDYQKIMIFYAGVIQALGEQLKVRQQVIATATIYLKRFYSKYSLKSIDPLLMAPTCVFLASKVEESGVITNSRLMAACGQVATVKVHNITAAQNVSRCHRLSILTALKLGILVHVAVKKFSYAFNSTEFPHRMSHVLECEFFLLEIMDCCLIVFHPYRPLMQYVADLGQEEQLLPLAWRIINDSLRTDVCLMYPPYLIALACLHMACVISQKDTKHWFAELNVDLDKILEITQQILKLYELWKNYDEKKDIQAILAKAPKPQLQPPPQTVSQGSSSDGAQKQQ